MKWGIDTFSRYWEDDDGERYMVEPFPYSGHPWHSLKARVEIIRWHLGIMRQHGLAEWNRLRKL